MKLTLGQMFAAQEELNQLINLPVKASTAFKISKNVNLIKEELAIIDEKRVELIQHYNVAEPENRSEETIQQFNEAFNDLLSTEVDVNINPISTDGLVDQSGNEVDISPATLMKIDWMFED